LDRGCGEPERPFIRDVRKWAFVGGQYDESIGGIVHTPWQLAEAQLVDNLCQRYGCLPSQLMEEDANWMLHALKMIGEVKEITDGE
jgi:hypothetical protein